MFKLQYLGFIPGIILFLVLEIMFIRTLYLTIKERDNELNIPVASSILAWGITFHMFLFIGLCLIWALS